ncbi:hypothetical protein CPC08DRAFT_709138 [Agrocybe pediades]|nr:hypothetical protein CPC08DRAFT_709138 [Agrocybe pediades]
MNTVGLETAALTLGRFSLFFACRKYLLRTLYSDLKSLSSSTTPGTPRTAHTPRPSSSVLFDSRSLHDNGEDDAIELDTLPVPTTQSRSNRHSDTAYVHSSVSRVIFSWCFAESCLLFVLLMLQGLGVFSPSTRLINWRISLSILMACILVAIPLSVSLLLALRTFDRFTALLRPRVIFLSFLPVFLYLFIFSHIPLPSSIEASNLDWTEATLSRLIILGTIVLGLLSGFGAVSSSWQYLPFGKTNESVPTERDIDTAQYALTSIRNDMRERQSEAARRAGNSPSGDASWFSRVGASFRGGGDSLSQELAGLTALEQQMSRNLEALRERYDAAVYSSTLRGKIWALIGRLVMIWCLWKGASATYNIVFVHSYYFSVSSPSTSSQSSSASYPDAITGLLAWVMSKLPSSSEKGGMNAASEKDKAELTRVAASISRQLSLILVGVIILSSVRGVLRTVTRALHITSRNLAASLMMLLLAQIMGIYMLSTLVQLRSSFPPPPTQTLSPLSSSTNTDLATTNLFSTIPVSSAFFSALFDWSYVAAGVLSLVVRWGRERVDGVGGVD